MPRGSAAFWYARAEAFRALLAEAGGQDLTARRSDGYVLPNVIQGSIELCLRLAAEAEVAERAAPVRRDWRGQRLD